MIAPNMQAYANIQPGDNINTMLWLSDTHHQSFEIL